MTLRGAKICRPSGIWEMPAETIRSGGYPLMVRPSKATLPSPMGTSPEMAFNRVDLPAPLAPMRATILPSGTVKETPLRARTGP